MFIEFVLSGGTHSTGVSGLFGGPVLAGLVAAAVAVLAVFLAGWRAGFATAAVGVLFLGCGLAGDMMSHSEQGRQRHEILHSMMQNPTATASQQLMELDSAEARNVWHFASAAGQGLLITGLAGAAFILWRQRRANVTWEEEVPRAVRRAA